MSGKLKTAVIGVGTIGNRHAYAYHDHDRSDLILVCDTNEERAQKISQTYNCEYTTEIADVSASDADVVSVCTPDFAHYEPVMAALSSGKHVLSEKPMAVDISEAKSMVSSAEELGLKLSVRLPRRWTDTYRKIKEAFDKGHLGTFVSGYVQDTKTLVVPTQNLVEWSNRSTIHWFLFHHWMDAISWITGEKAVEVYAKEHRGVLEGMGFTTNDHVQALVTYESGAFCTFETGWINPPDWQGPGARTDLVFTNARTSVMQPGRPELDTGYHTRPKTHRSGGEYAYIQTQPVKDFVDAVLDKQPPLVSPEEALQTVAMIVAVDRSIAENKPITTASVLASA